MPSLKRPARTSTRWKAMWGNADETERLPFAGLTSPSEASPNRKGTVFCPQCARRKVWLAAGHPAREQESVIRVVQSPAAIGVWVEWL